MSLVKHGGVFSQRMFHQKVYDTGGRSKPRFDDDEQLGFDYYRHALREDIEIIEFILAVTTSGMLED